MSKIVETTTEFCCLAENPSVNPNAALVAQYHSNTARSVANSYGLIRGIAYASSSLSSLETVNGIPPNANIRLFNTMSAVPLLVQANCSALTSSGGGNTINLTTGINGSISIPSQWGVTWIKLGQAAILSNGTVNINLPLTTPTTAAIFWWL